MTPDKPHTSPRRILLAVTGLSPQIVTESIYALAVQATPPWIPHEVHLITTVRGADNARLKLLSREPGWFHRLRADYDLPEIAFDDAHIHVMERSDGTHLEDIRDDTDNQCAADFIAETVRRLTLATDTEIHASIAGGRKTMGFYLGYAMSLYGRAQDRLSHVLVSAPFESHPEFYYPTPATRVITSLDRAQDALDCSQARVWLGDIPFVRLRDGLPQRLLEGAASFSHVVAVANRAQGEPHLVIDLSARTVQVDDEDLTLGKVDFALLLWLARRAKKGEDAVDWGSPEAGREFLASAKNVINPASGEFERIEEALNWRKTAAIKQAKYFEPHKTRVNNALKALLGERAAQRYAIQRIKAGEGYRYLLPLTPAQIEIRD